MTRPAFLLALGHNRWTAVRIAGDAVETREVAVADAAEPEKAYADAAAALAQLGYTSQDVCLGLPSDMVLVGAIDCGNLPRRHRREAMLYRLEDQFPLEIERLTADFLPPAGGRAAGLAVETDRVRTVIDRLSAAGVETACIVPTAILTLWSALAHVPKDTRYAILVGGTTFDLFRLTDGPSRSALRNGPAAWHTMPANGEDLIRTIKADLLSRPDETEAPRAIAFGDLPDESLASLHQEIGIPLARADDAPAPLALAAQAAAEHLAGRSAGWIDFRQGALAAGGVLQRLGGRLTAAAVLLLALLATAAGLLACRGLEYGCLARRHEDAQARVYAKVFPTGRVPADVRARMEKELARVEGVRGGRAGLPTRTPALDMLRAVVAHLPGELRMRLTSIQLGEAGLVLKGQARSHSDAQTVAQALRQGGFAVNPPSTESLVRGGVAFTLTGRPAATTESPGALQVARQNGRSP